MYFNHIFTILYKAAEFRRIPPFRHFSAVPPIILFFARKLFKKLLIYYYIIYSYNRNRVIFL